MKKLGIFVACLALVVASTGAMAANLVADPGFEGGTPNATWTEASTNFGTPLCDLFSCGAGGGTGPHSGDWWAWFGGIGTFEQGIVSQAFVIPAGASTLTFWFENPVTDTAADFIDARIDGSTVWSYSADGSIPLYTQIVVDISGFDDGGAHTLEFFSEIFAVGGTGSNFFVDDVEIDDGFVPAGTGACCEGADVCNIVSELDCDAIGGFYQGDDTPCVADSGATADYMDTPGLVIPDNDPAGTTTVIVVPDSFTIADLDVDFITDHTWIGDLLITVQSPAGTVVVLQDGDFSSDEGENVIFNDEGAPLVSGDPVTGDGFAPTTGSLSDFDGQDSAGPWTLFVSDSAGLDTGSILQWSLHFDIGESTCDDAAGACCTDDPGVASSCIETSQAECEADNGLFVGGSCADVVDCLPLFVEFDSVEAIQTARGVSVSWVTSLESDTVGFSVYSQTGREKGMKFIADVHAAGVGTVGASYQVFDAGAKASNGTVYFIGDTDINGRETMHGPFEITGARVRSAGRGR